jgi:hypothetical protein
MSACCWAQVAAWAACGGRSSTPAQQNAADPAYCCASGTACTLVNEWYWQCLPAGGGISSGGNPSERASTSTAAGPSTGSGASAGSSDALSMWDQCGGMGGNCQSYGCADAPYSGASCPAGASCSRLSTWYHQCVPRGSASQQQQPGQQQGGSSGSYQPGQVATPGSSSGASIHLSTPAASAITLCIDAFLLLLHRRQRRQQLIILGLLGDHQAGAARPAGPWAGTGAGVLQGVARRRRLPASSGGTSHGRCSGAGPGSRGACAGRQPW